MVDAFLNGLDLVGVRLDSVVRNKETQQLSRWYTKGTLGGIELDIYLS
jgi:hypothetical protein